MDFRSCLFPCPRLSPCLRGWPCLRRHTASDEHVMLYGFDNCEELLDDIEQNITKIDSLKRRIGEDDEIHLASPKRTKTEECENDTVWVQSPNEPYRLAATIRALLRMHKGREVCLHRRETMIDKRELRVENREIRMDNREVRADKKEATLEEIKSDLDQKYEAYRSALAADTAKKNGTEPTEPEKKTSTVAETIEKTKEMIEKGDTYATLLEFMEAHAKEDGSGRGR